MKFKDGDRVHVTLWHDTNVDFYATLKDSGLTNVFQMINTSNTSNPAYDGCTILKSHLNAFGKGKRDYYTLVEEENRMTSKEIIQNLEAIIERLKKGEVEPRTYREGQDDNSTFLYLSMVNKPNQIKQAESKEEQLSKLEPYINNYLLYSFEDTIVSHLYSTREDTPSTLIHTNILKRGIGKTSTLAYLALKYDLPLIVSNHIQKKELAEQYPYLTLYTSNETDRLEAEAEAEADGKGLGEIFLVDSEGFYYNDYYYDNRVGVFIDNNY